MLMRPPEPSEPSTNQSSIVLNGSKKSKEGNKIETTDKELGLLETDSDDDEETFKIIHVCTRKVGYLVGHQGRTIWGFEKSSGAKIDILTPNSKDDETPVRLSGSPEAVKSVIRMIMDLYGQNTLSSRLWYHNNLKGEIIATEEIIIPKSSVPYVIGSKGGCIDDIEMDHGVKILVGQHVIEQYYIPINVTGSGPSIRLAIKAIRQLIKEFNNSGYQHYYPHYSQSSMTPYSSNKRRKLKSNYYSLADHSLMNSPTYHHNTFKKTTSTSRHRFSHNNYYNYSDNDDDTKEDLLRFHDYPNSTASTNKYQLKSKKYPAKNGNKSSTEKSSLLEYNSIGNIEVTESENGFLSDISLSDVSP